MSELTVIGLGAMGSAIAQALIDRGHALTLWNRNPAKAPELAGPGVERAASLEEAVAASPVILVCIHGYAATRALLDAPAIAPLLQGRTLLQTSTGTPAEARQAERWIDDLGGRYLDCSIMVYPPSVGKADGQLLVSGAGDAWNDCRGLLDGLGGDIRYLGSTIGAAAALDLASVTRLVTNTVGIVYGLQLCDAENVPLAQFADLFPVGDRARHLAAAVDSGNYDDGIVVSVSTAIEVVSAIRSLAVERGINTELPDFILGLYRRAAAAGYLEQDNASLVEVFRNANRHR